MALPVAVVRVVSILALHVPHDLTSARDKNRDDLQIRSQKHNMLVVLLESLGDISMIDVKVFGALQPE